MTPEKLIGLLEEMIDLKIQLYVGLHLRPTPDLTRLLSDKRESDKRRLEEIRLELAEIMRG